MAARLNNRHQQMVRDKIQVSQLINRLQDHIDTKIILSATQVDAAKYLISQGIGSPPTSATLSGDMDAPLFIKGAIELVRPAGD